MAINIDTSRILAHSLPGDSVTFNFQLYAGYIEPVEIFTMGITRKEGIFESQLAQLVSDLLETIDESPWQITEESDYVLLCEVSDRNSSRTFFYDNTSTNQE